MFGTAFHHFEMWKHFDMCAKGAAEYAMQCMLDCGDMPKALENTKEAIHCLKRIKWHMFEGRFVDYKTKEDPIDDSIKKLRAALRTTPVRWNPYHMTPTSVVTVKAKYIQGEGRWLYPDQLALSDPHFDDRANYRV